MRFLSQGGSAESAEWRHFGPRWDWSQDRRGWHPLLSIHDKRPRGFTATTNIQFWCSSSARTNNSEIPTRKSQLITRYSLKSAVLDIRVQRTNLRPATVENAKRVFLQYCAV
jgi:hypothetical protein